MLAVYTTTHFVTTVPIGLIFFIWQYCLKIGGRWQHHISQWGKSWVFVYYLS